MRLPKDKIRLILIGDKSASQDYIVEAFEQDPQTEIALIAQNPPDSFDQLANTEADAILLNVEDKGSESFNWLRNFLHRNKIPVIVVSSQSSRGKKVTIDALSSGAVDVIIKDQGQEYSQVFLDKLLRRVKFASASVSATKIRQLAHIDRAPTPPALSTKIEYPSRQRVIAIGTSAGGVSALGKIIPAFPADSPPILIVQHMPAGFTRNMAERLNLHSAIDVKEAEDGDLLRTGVALVAPGGNQHMRIHELGGKLYVKLETGPKISGHLPSVDALFFSVAEAVGPMAIGILMTGMGSDGARGLLAIRQAGGRTFAQDKATSVVFGMPASAWELGAAEKLVPLEELPSQVLEVVGSEALTQPGE